MPVRWSSLLIAAVAAVGLSVPSAAQSPASSVPRCELALGVGAYPAVGDEAIRGWGGINAGASLLSSIGCRARDRLLIGASLEFTGNASALARHLLVKGGYRWVERSDGPTFETWAVAGQSVWHQTSGIWLLGRVSLPHAAGALTLGTDARLTMPVRGRTVGWLQIGWRVSWFEAVERDSMFEITGRRTVAYHALPIGVGIGYRLPPAGVEVEPPGAFGVRLRLDVAGSASRRFCTAPILVPGVGLDFGSEWVTFVEGRLFTNGPNCGGDPTEATADADGNTRIESIYGGGVGFLVQAGFGRRHQGARGHTTWRGVAGAAIDENGPFALRPVVGLAAEYAPAGTRVFVSGELLTYRFEVVERLYGPSPYPGPRDGPMLAEEVHARWQPAIALGLGIRL